MRDTEGGRRNAAHVKKLFQFLRIPQSAFGRAYPLNSNSRTLCAGRGSTVR